MMPIKKAKALIKRVRAGISEPTRRRLLIIKQILVAAAVIIIASIFVGAIDCATFESWSPLEAKHTGKINNGVWLRYFWYSGKLKQDEQEKMLERFNDHKIRYAFFHVLETTKDGNLRWLHEDNALQITSAVHAKCPDVKVVAWVYIPSHTTDISESTVRNNLIKTARWLTETCHFDGVQWDYEFAPSGKQSLVDLCVETKENLPDKFLSVATPMWYSGTKWGWSDEYFKKIAAHCDQIAIMGYDSVALTPQQYIEQLAEQIHHVGSDTADANCSVILGIPTYEDMTAAHHFWVENLRTSIRGWYQGLARYPEDAKKFEGVSLFADYTTDQSEWNEYDTYLQDATAKQTTSSN